jgi:hypothetical protein
MKVCASLTPTQAQRMMPGAPFRILVPLPRIARHLGPRQSRGPGGSNEMVAASAHRLVGGLRLLAKRPTATATRMAPGNKAPNQ